VAIEAGVGYGITSALILSAMERNRMGVLISIDLPPLSDPEGAFIGIAVPERLRERWLLRFGSSRRWLPDILKRVEEVGLFISDSANVYTLQRYEFTKVWPKVVRNGVCIFNNISNRFWHFLESFSDAHSYAIWQVEKSSCVTGLIIKR
jgi:hypothetical protein